MNVPSRPLRTCEAHKACTITLGSYMITVSRSYSSFPIQQSTTTSPPTPPSSPPRISRPKLALQYTPPCSTSKPYSAAPPLRSVVFLHINDGRQCCWGLQEPRAPWQVILCRVLRRRRYMLVVGVVRGIGAICLCPSILIPGRKKRVVDM